LQAGNKFHFANIRDLQAGCRRFDPVIAHHEIQGFSSSDGELIFVRHNMGQNHCSTANNDK
jgi:hypothetical protein